MAFKLPIRTASSCGELAMVGFTPLSSKAFASKPAYSAEGTFSAATRSEASSAFRGGSLPATMATTLGRSVPSTSTSRLPGSKKMPVNSTFATVTATVPSVFPDWLTLISVSPTARPMSRLSGVISTMPTLEQLR